MQCSRRTRGGIVLVCTLALAPTCLAQPGATGDSPPAAARPSNFAFAPDQKTCALGDLGHVETMGTGATHLILIPGAAFGWETWRGFMERHLNDYTMHAFTPAGYGGTNPPPLPENPEAFTDEPWTRAFLEGVHRYVIDNKIEDPIVIGHHLLGGYYAVRLACEHPEAYSGAVSVSGEASRPLTVTTGPNPGTNLNATREEMAAHVHTRWVPFFRTVSPDTWKRNTYSASKLSADTERGTRLFNEQVGVPLSIQLRYFLEFMADNIVPAARSTKTPILVLWPSGSGEIYERLVTTFMNTGLDRAAAEAQADAALAGQYGSKEKALKAMSRNPWSAIENPAIQIEAVEGSGIFIMDDKPEWFDEQIDEFVKRTRN